VPLADAGISLAKLDVVQFCGVGVFSRQFDNLFIRVRACDLAFRPHHARHEECNVATTTAYIQALHSFPETNRV
jgi:hypothetical protein